MRILFPGSILTALLFVAGCMGGSPPSPVSTSGAASGTTSVTAQPDPVASTATTPVTSPVASPSKILTLGRIPFSNATTMVRDHQEFLALLAAEIGYDHVELRLEKNYDQVIEKLGKGEWDLAWMGTCAYVPLRQKYGIPPLVRPIRYGKDYYRGQIVVRVDSGINSLLELKGKTMGFVDRKSASGYLYPKALLIQNGINADSDFSRIDFLGKHDNVVLNVFLKTFDAGACFDDARTAVKDFPEEKRNQLKILATTENIPNEPICCRKDMPDDLREKIKKALLKLSDPAHKEALKKCGNLEGFVEARESDYDSVGKALELVPDFKE